MNGHAQTRLGDNVDKDEYPLTMVVYIGLVASPAQSFGLAPLSARFALSDYQATTSAVMASCEVAA